jgi:hypothetical protein
MNPLERELFELGRALDYPPAPDVAAAVTARLTAAPRPGRRLRLPAFRALAIAAAVLLVGAGGVLAASPGARDAVLDWLGLRGATIRRVETLPSVPRTSPRAPLELGRRVSLAEARTRAGFRPLVARALGTPDRVHVDEIAPEVRQVALVYRPRGDLPADEQTGVGLLLTEMQAALDETLIEKLAGPGTRIRRVRVGTGPAVVLFGAPHLFHYIDPQGRVYEEDFRLAGNTLLWEREGLLLRIEADLPPAELLRVARSVR